MGISSPTSGLSVAGLQPALWRRSYHKLPVRSLQGGSKMHCKSFRSGGAWLLPAAVALAGLL